MPQTSKIFYQLKPLLQYVPSVEPPEKRVSLQDKLLWTLGCLLVFLVASQTGLYGIRIGDKTPDPWYWFRAVLASNRGTLMELGISPVVTSSLVMQLLIGSKLLHVDYSNKEDSALYTSAQKLCAIVITVGEALAYVVSGMYGTYSELGLINFLLVFVQLIVAGVMVIFLDEVMQRGYGMGSGISLFIATNICDTIVWKALSPSTIVTGAGPQYEGAIIALFHLILTRKRTIPALKEAFYRNSLPNVINLMATVVVFVFVIFFQGFRVELPVKTQKLRGTQTKYPIKLFYTSNIPIILLSALISNCYFLSQVLNNRFGNGNIITGLLGKWHTNTYGVSQPVGGLVYYMSPPRTFVDLISDPIHAIVYVTFVLAACAIFSVTWIEVSGSSSRDVAKQLKDQGLIIPGYRENMTVQVLDRYIPIAAAFGGMCIGALTIFADFMGAIGSGTGILLVVTIIFEIFEAYVREAQAEGLSLAMPKMAF